VNAEEFEALVHAVQRDGTDAALVLHPAAAEFAAALAELEGLATERDVLAQLTQRAADRVGIMATAIAQAMGVNL